MALSRDALEAVARAIRPARRGFGEQFRALLLTACGRFDVALRRDTQAMAGIFPDGVSSGDRVILRQRFLWLLADRREIRGPTGLPQTWSEPTTLRALEGAEGGARRCPRPGAPLKVLLSLTEYYATETLDRELVGRISDWIEATTRSIVDALDVADGFAIVRATLEREVQAESLVQLMRLGDLRAHPNQIDQAPFQKPQ